MFLQICVSRASARTQRWGRLTSAVLVVSIPGDGGNEVDAGKSCHETLETVSLATLRAIWPVPVGVTPSTQLLNHSISTYKRRRSSALNSHLTLAAHWSAATSALIESIDFSLSLNVADPECTASVQCVFALRRKAYLLLHVNMKPKMFDLHWVVLCVKCFPAIFHQRTKFIVYYLSSTKVLLKVVNVQRVSYGKMQIIDGNANMKPFIISSKTEQGLNNSRFRHVPCLPCLLNTPLIAWYACTQAAGGYS